MNFHDNRGMYDEIAKWLEKHDVEVDWEAVMQCKWWVGPKDWVPPPKWSQPLPWPRRLTSQMVTKLLLAQENRGLAIPEWIVDPNEQRENVVLVHKGGEGVEPRLAGELTTGLSYWEKFLLQLEGIQVAKVTISLVGLEDRKRLVRMAWIEEELRRREIERNRERVRRQLRGEAAGYMSRKLKPKLVERAKAGNLEAISELERRGMDRVEIARMRELANRKADRMREVALKRWESGGRIGRRTKGGRLEMKKEEGKVNERAEGEADTEARGTALGGAVRLEEPAGLLPEVAEGWGEAGEESAGMKEEVALGNGVALGPVKQGIERELEVIRVGPNPRILTCRYRELASERVCKVWVKSVANFVRGMKFRMAEPLDELEYAGVWRYEGPLPRARGRW
jgi:hypothetical protein